MVAVTTQATTSDELPVVLAAGEQASGLAHMVAQYLEQLLAEQPEKRRQAARLRGGLGLVAREGNVAVTVRFEGDRVRIEEGLQDPQATIAGPVETLLHLLAGRVNPVAALVRREVSLRPDPRRPLFGYQAYRLMRLPGVHLWQGLPVARVSAVVAAMLLAACIVRRLSRRGQGGG